MTNQIPHTPTPGFQIRPPVITKELQRLVEENKKLIKTALPAMEANERRKRELELQKQNQLPDYTEVAWLKVLNQNLDKPQCPEVKLLKKWQKYRKCCCWELEYEWEIYYQYDFAWAQKEAEFRWIEVLSCNNWTNLGRKLWIVWLKQLLWLKEQKDYKGYYEDDIFHNLWRDIYFWTSSIWDSFSTNPNNFYKVNLDTFNTRIFLNKDIQSKCFSVRCRLKD